MTDLDQIITISPIQPSTGPLSRQVGGGSPLSSLYGVSNPQQGFMIVSEAIQALQDQIEALRKLLTLSPSINSINFPILIITDLQFTNNSPSAGNISWTACTIYYQGQVYGISAGNTTGGSKLVWWVVGAASFSSGNSFTPNVTTFGIATNTTGTYDITWNKVGANSIQSSQVIGGLLPSGYHLQSASIDFTFDPGGTGTTVLSYSGGAGALLTVFYLIDPTSGYATNTGHTTTLAITLDGNATVYTLTTSNGGALADDSYSLQPSSNLIYGSLADKTPMIMGFNLPFASSIAVTISNQNGGSGPGHLHVAIGWAKAL